MSNDTPAAPPRNNPFTPPPPDTDEELMQNYEDSDFDIDPALNSTPEYPLPRNVTEYSAAFRALEDSPVHAAVMEEFFLLCLLRFGKPETSTDKSDRASSSWPDRYFDTFMEFRNSVYPDYYANPRIPVLEPVRFVRWCNTLHKTSSTDKPLTEKE